jgi:hypothetical protein
MCDRVFGCASAQRETQALQQKVMSLQEQVHKYSFDAQAAQV